MDERESGFRACVVDRSSLNEAVIASFSPESTTVEFWPSTAEISNTDSAWPSGHSAGRFFVHEIAVTITIAVRVTILSVIAFCVPFFIKK